MNKIKLITLLTTSILLTACVDTEKNKLDNRVLAYWGHKINRDFKQAYQYLSPGWKSNESWESYVRRMSLSKIKWTSVSIKDKKCSQKDLCTIATNIGYEYRFRGTSEKIQVETTIKEKWLMKNNIWYFIPIKTNN